MALCLPIDAAWRKFATREQDNAAFALATALERVTGAKTAQEGVARVWAWRAAVATEADHDQTDSVAIS